jgi:hypothetical protein
MYNKPRKITEENMVAEITEKQVALYDSDFNLWVLETVKKLERRDLSSLDIENLIEEVSDLSRRDKNKLESLLIKLFEHLLKLTYWKSEIEYNRGHWEGEIINFRLQIKRLLKSSPSLKPYLKGVLEECYQDSRKILSKRLQIPINAFPEKPIATLEKVLDEDWLP